MRVLPVLVVILLAGAALAQELTVAEVVAAHRAGAPEEGILRLIQQAPSVASLAPADRARLRAAGVPERVIEAMVARAAPARTPARPDDPHLVDVVRAVSSGLSAELVAERVRRSGHRYALSPNDLAYLRENNVSDLIIGALGASGAPPTPVPTLPPPAPTPALAAPPLPVSVEPMTFGPLLRMTGVFRRESTGLLVLTADRLDWRDARGSAQDESLPVATLRAAWLATVARGGRGSVAELRVRTVTGGDLAFRDADWASGGDARVAELYRVLEERFPQLILRDRAPR